VRRVLSNAWRMRASASAHTFTFKYHVHTSQEFVRQEFSSVYSEDELKAVNLVHDLSALQPLFSEYTKVLGV